jgi:Flp pilus assembly protein TadD
VVRLQPDDAKARTTLAEALDNRAHQLGRNGNLKEAAAAFRELVALKPGDTDAQTNLGVALARQGQLDEAKMLFERAPLLNPQNTAARQNLDRVNALLHP